MFDDVILQGNCKCSYAFSAAGSLEGQYFKKTSILVSLSKQQIVDCSWYYGNQGCITGTVDNTFRYLAVYGSEYELYYKYEGVVRLLMFS